MSSAGEMTPSASWQQTHTDWVCSTVLEREPKVGSRHIDLLRLWKRVNDEGGYDKVSDIKGNKLAWRRIASEFLPSGPSLTTQAFLVKSTYYRNLAYVQHHWHALSQTIADTLQGIRDLDRAQARAAAKGDPRGRLC